MSAPAINYKNPELQAKPLMILMAVIAISAIPHFLRISPVLSGLIIGAFALKFLLLRYGRMATNKALLIIMTVCITLLVVMNYGTINGHEAGSALLLGMLSLKLLEARTYRDAMVSTFIAYFLCAVNFLFTQSIPTAAWMLVQVVLLTYCLISINQIRFNTPAQYRRRFAFKAVAQAIPLMIIMFILFPRIPGPLWGIPKPTNQSTTGFSEDMSPGKFSELAQSGAVAFRVNFDSNIPPQPLLYWRALTLWHYDGLTWNKRKSVPSQAAPFEYNGDPVNYTVTLEPHNNKSLFALDMPTQFKNADKLDRNYQLSSKREITKVTQYSVTSYLNYTINPKLEPFEWRKGLQLPKGFNPKTIALGKQWRSELGNAEAVVKHALQFFHQEQFYYTLQPPPIGRNKADDFLFNTRKGFCEYYSNAFVILMRAADIPARVVVGYMGGEANPLNGNLTVRQSDAHAWAEVWLPQQGWVRVDPTAAVAPERVEQNLDAALPDEERVLVPFTAKTSVLKNLVNLWDAADSRWNEWVLGYGPEFQKQFLRRFGLQNFMHFTYAMMALLAIFIAIFSFFMFKPPKATKLSDAQKLYRKFCKRMARKGHAREQHETATDYIVRLSHYYPERTSQFKSIAESYNRLQYQGMSPALYQQLKTQINDMKNI